MSKGKKALGEATAFLRQFRNLLDYEDELEQAGSFENLIAKRKADLAELDAKAGLLDAKLAAAEVERVRIIEAGNAEAAAIVAEVQAQTPGILDRAKSEAAVMGAEIIAAANAQAEGIVASSRKEVSGILASANARAAETDAAALERVAAADARIATAEQSLRDVVASIKAANQQLAAVNTEIDRLRNRFAAA